jgi:hypothetical protein
LKGNAGEIVAYHYRFDGSGQEQRSLRSLRYLGSAKHCARGSRPRCVRVCTFAVRREQRCHHVPQFSMCLQKLCCPRVRRFLVARAIEDRAALQCCREAVAAKSTMVCRLVANIGSMRRRVRRRESGVLQEQFVARVAKLNSILDGARLEDFSVNSDARSVTQIAHEMLFKAGWISQ